MRQRIDGVRARHLILRGGFVLLMLGLIAFSVYQLTQHVTAGAQTLRTQVITDRSYMQLDLYVHNSFLLIQDLLFHKIRTLNIGKHPIPVCDTPLHILDNVLRPNVSATLFSCNLPPYST